MSELIKLIDRHCHSETTVTQFPRLALARSVATTSFAMATPPPMVCVIAQGRKRILLGNEEFTYDPSTYLITSADLPVRGQVIEAPYLGLALTLDLGTLAELALEIAARVGPRHRDDVTLDHGDTALGLESVVLGEQVGDGVGHGPQSLSSPPPTLLCWLDSGCPSDHYRAIKGGSQWGVGVAAYAATRFSLPRATRLLRAALCP